MAGSNEEVHWRGSGNNTRPCCQRDVVHTLLQESDDNPHDSLGPISSICRCLMSLFNKEINRMGLQRLRFRSNAFVHFSISFSTCRMLYSHQNQRCPPLLLSLHPCLAAGSCSLRTLAAHLLQGSLWLRVQRRICCVCLNAFASVCVCV